jgi:GTP-binding protein LepA
MEKIRNFSIIAHIDHGKSTLADRMLEITNTIPARKMQDQVLDSMELEREKGITIKMRPVRMEFENYILNLIDTPGHIDFFYEVSRALKAVEGSILLVDATQGVQAQTLTTLQMARESGLTIIPVLSKIDSPLARIEEIRKEICELLDCQPKEIMETSGKTGAGVEELLREIIKRIPPPKAPVQAVSQDKNNIEKNNPRALIFDFQYSNHKGVIVYVRVFGGSFQKGMPLLFRVADEKFISLEVGVFTPDEEPRDTLREGEIGYIVTGIKKPGIASVGDTVTSSKNPAEPLSGYMSPSPVVWASIYPEDADDFELLRQALGRLRLSDSSFSYEEESSGSLGRGFRCGFLGLLHLEIITERLKREFRLELVIATPSITYEVVHKNGKKETIYSPSLFPQHGLYESVYEPWVKLKIISPSHIIGSLLKLLHDHEAELGNSETFGDGRTTLHVNMPLRELMRNFFDELKSVSSGFASL